MNSKFDNVGWVRGTKSLYGQWGAHIWTMQNMIVFLFSSTNRWVSPSNGVRVEISNVMVGSLGDYQAMSNVVDIGPVIPSNFPGANQNDSGTYQVDITNVYYELIIPDIWITPRYAETYVGGSNVQYTVTGTNIPQGVTWSLIPDLSGSGGATIQTNGAWQTVITPGNVATNYKVRATSVDNPNFYDEVTLTVLKVELTNIKFNWDAASSSEDAINIRRDYTNAYDISNGEWVKGGTTIPVCYTINKAVTIKARVMITPAVNVTADIWAVSTDSGGSLGDVMKTNVTFSGGVSSPEYVTFQISGTTPNCIKKTTTDVWAWKIENVNGYGSAASDLNTSGVHTVYTILAEPALPWENTPGNQKNAWTKALDYSCVWAFSEISESGCLAKITQRIYSDLGGHYDTTWGAPSYTDDGGTANFRLTAFLNAVALANIGKVNCYDCGKSVVSLTSLLGCNASYKYSRPFGYLNCVKPIGKGWANNPFYDNPSYINLPVTGEDDDYNNGRSGFDNHAFGSISTMIWDACLKGNTGVNPDTTNNVVETWMTGQPWNTYTTIIVDDIPYTATGLPIDYGFGLE